MEVPFHLPARPIGVEGDTFVTPVPGRPDALFVVWLGGTCDEQANLEYTGGDTTFTLITSRRAVDCDAQGVGRSIVVVFESPVDSSSFVLRDMS